MRTYGSVRGALSDERPYRDSNTLPRVPCMITVNRTFTYFTNSALVSRQIAISMNVKILS